MRSLLLLGAASFAVATGTCHKRDLVNVEVVALSTPTPSVSSSSSLSPSQGLSSTPTPSSSTQALSSSLSSVSSSVSTPSSSSSSSATRSASGSIITVATDGSGQFTAISPALSYAQNSGYPTVTIKAGTYTDSVIVQATAAVTVIGESSSSNDYTQNKVVVSNQGTPLFWNTDNNSGTTWKNINFINTASSSAYAISLRGARHSFHNCQIVSAGATAIYFYTTTAFIYNSYVEAQSKIFSNTPNLYVYGSTIVPTASSALLVYNKGFLSGSTVINNSTVVMDSCTVAPKSASVSRMARRAAVSNVFLAAANGDGSVVVYRNSALSGIFAATGVYADAKTGSKNNFYGEFANTGAGAYAANQAARAPYVNALTADQVAQFSIDQVFGKAPSSVASSNTDWLDSAALAVVRSSDSSQAAAAVALSSASSAVSSSSSSSSSSVVSSSSTQSMSTPAVAISTPSSSVSSSSVSSSSVSSSSVSSSSVSSDSASSTPATPGVVSSSSTTSTPAFSTPDSQTPSTPSVNTPSTPIPSTSSVNTPSTPTHSTPSVDTPLTPSTPSVNTPSTPTPSTPGASASSTPSSSSTVSTSFSSACTLPSTVPTTAYVVGPVGSCAKYNNVSSAVVALPADSTTQYIYILAGTYVEQITISRVGATVFRGETSSTLQRRVTTSSPPLQSSNQVTIKFTAGVLSSNGGSSGTSPFQATQYYAKSLSFYNINFENDYSPVTGYNAVAMSGKALQLGFYNCGIKSSQGALLLNYGAYYFAGCTIEGTTDIIWGQGGAYFYNSKIISDGVITGQTIASQSYQSQYGPSQFVFDTCVFAPSAASVPQSSTYLGRDYSTSAKVAVINSYLDAHIAPAGWLVSAKTTNVTFVEGSNTGPGSSTTSRTHSQVLTDLSAYSAANVLGSTSWIDTSAIPAFAGFPDSVYASIAVSSSSIASTPATPSASTPSAFTPSASTPSSVALSNSTSISASASSTSAAATASSTLIVSTTPAANEYANVTAAIAALPNDGKAYTIYIRAGTYTEQFSITRNGKTTLRGETDFANDYSQNKVTIQFSSGVLTSAGQDEQTPVINAKKTDTTGFALYNINFVNTYPQTKNTAALAADFYGPNMAAYGCKFVGYQDTLLANKGTQVFSNCYIEGSVDYIWGFSTAFFHQCYIAANTAGGSVSAMSRVSATTAGGYVFDKCYVTYTSTYGSTFGTSFLGRPYSSYSIAVYTNSYIDKHISPAGWSVWQTSNPQTDNVMFGEYNNVGPGSWSSSRASFATNLSDSQAASYSLSAWIGDTTWLDMDTYNLAPSFSITGTAASATSSSTASTTPSATATWAHPTSGATPPIGAVLVSVGGSVNGSYSNLTAALASLPSDASTQIIFMYPGTYNEQVPSVNRLGPVQIIGAQDGSPGQSYKTNKVILTQARGLSLSPLEPGHSDAETATFTTASTKIALYNIDIINSDNMDGSQSSYVTLAASIYGSHIAFYGCSFLGWQDTLLTGSTNGYQYYESCYIEGAIDFIWGYSKAYFKGCTIGAKRQKSAMTAHSRASLSAIGGYIFDQCLFTAASTATVDLTNSVYLGRPYSQYASVVIKNSYLDSTIQPAGWKVWSTTDPRTDSVTFAEYNNAGPGNWENNAAARTATGFCTLLTSDTYSLSSVMDSTDWIDSTYWNSITTPVAATTSSSSSNATVTVNGTSVYDGTAPPAGAYVVSKTAITGVTTYDTIQSALDALPTSSSKTATVFIYPGVYNEQLVLSKSGTTIFVGYSNATDDYSQNQVTITFNKGIDTQADASNSDSATVYATGNYFQAYNINFRNSFGTTQDYASLGFGVKSSKYASLYGCQVYGNQDSLLINGYFFAFKSYIEGNIDMIWGSGAGYFLDSTISPNTDGVSLTANKRATNTTQGGFVFDQCTVKPAAGTGPFTEISLGRPWNNFARVAFIETYLDSSVEAAGWSQWSKSSPQTNGVTFGEFANTGPGARTSGRASFSTQLSAADAAQFQLNNFFTVTSWINFTHVDVNPFVAASAVVPSLSAVSVSATSTSSSTKISSSSSSAVLSTVYVTKVTTDKETLFTTVTADVPTVSAQSTITQDIGATVTPAPVYQTSTLKSTISIVQTVTEPDVTQTTTQTVTSDIGTIITPVPSTVTSTVKDTTTVFATSYRAQTVTVQTVVTSTNLVTKSVDPATTTLSLGSTVTVTSFSTPKSSKVTSTAFVTSGNGGTTTTTAKAATTTVSVTSTKTTTKKSTTTLDCIPTVNALKRRSVSHPHAPRAAGAVTVTTYSTLLSYVKTSTATLPASSTVTAVILTTKTVGSTTTLKPSTITAFATSFATKSSSTVLPGSTTVVTVTSTKLTGKTTTLKASTATVLTTSFATRTATTTITAAAVTATSTQTATLKLTTTLPQSTRTVTLLEDVTSTVVSTVAASTSTAWRTSTVTLAPSVTQVSQPTSTKVTTVKMTSTVVEWATKTAKGAAACTEK